MVQALIRLQFVFRVGKFKISGIPSVDQQARLADGIFGKGGRYSSADLDRAVIIL